jgi:hypothetical protein
VGIVYNKHMSDNKIKWLHRILYKKGYDNLEVGKICNTFTFLTEDDFIYELEEIKLAAIIKLVTNYFKQNEGIKH